MKFDLSKPAPKPAKHPQTITQHGIDRVDDYAWLRADNWQDVMQDPSQLQDNIRTYLETENNYFNVVTQPLSSLSETIFQEMKGRLEPTESDVPSPDGAYAYFHSFRKGDQYGAYQRAKLIDRNTLETVETEILLDIDHLKTDFEGYFKIGAIEHSPDHKRLAYSLDNSGAENFTIYIKDFVNGYTTATSITRASCNIVWAKDSETLFWVERDDNQRPCFVYSQNITRPNAQAKLIHQESDPGFFVSIGQSDSGDFIEINIHNHTTSEIWLIDAYKPDRAPQCFAPRLDGCEYNICDHKDQFFIHTNYQGAVDFQIMTCPKTHTTRDKWQIYEPHISGRLILTTLLYENHLVTMERENALPKITIRNLSDNHAHIIAFDEAAYSLGLEPSLEFKTSILRFSYSSPTTPTQIFDYDMDTQTRQLRKTRHIPSGHIPSNYLCERVMVPARDGETIPVTILRHKDTPIDGTAPCLLYGYGSYGYTIPASFRTSLLSLVDRGFIYAIAHIRGSQAKGYQWYLDGKKEKKTNSFYDFIDSAKALITQNYTSAGKIVIHGGSAGGLLVGATVNLAPELLAGVIADVPFVDVLTTVSDDTLPLTPPEWPEWGNPITSPDDYKTIAAYSPYDCVQAQNYPPIMITAGLTDPRVTYWEPAKWAAKLREYQQNQNAPIILKTNMRAGHAGVSGRYDSLKELAEEYAFAISVCAK